MGAIVAKRRSRAGLWAMAALVTVVALGAWAVWYSMLRPTPQRTVQRFIAAALSGKPEFIKPLLARSSQQRAAEFARHIPTVPGIAPANAIKFYRFGPARVRGDSAMVPMILQLPPEVAKLAGLKEYTVNWRLVREEGRWVIDLESTVAGSPGLGQFGQLEGKIPPPSPSPQAP